MCYLQVIDMWQLVKGLFPFDFVHMILLSPSQWRAVTGQGGTLLDYDNVYESCWRSNCAVRKSE